MPGKTIIFCFFLLPFCFLGRTARQLVGALINTIIEKLLPDLRAAFSALRIFLRYIVSLNFGTDFQIVNYLACGPA
ncbi:predicted protein [Methanosarcina acetivorans C2A]|uniref:Uncharacterized protein n=1 Tax=Methanosarcina acetivorans (strain ATCC 35395 / DSM 2834 / JCM 12185 / C2A) TaxID=188937 RepID=Q8TJR6_METAC|nr:predicted protein [Methanosarcina acetivorans C2A]